MSNNVFTEIRRACASVVQQARHVHLNISRIAAYATALPLGRIRAAKPAPRYHYYGPDEVTVAYLLCLDAINFGSAYFPYLRKPKTFSGHFDAYFAIAAALKERFERQGAFTADELSALTAQDCARLFGQTLDDGPGAELMDHFAAAWNELGRYLLAHFEGQFTNLVAAAGQSAARLVSLLAGMRYFQDVALYHGFEVPFYKRAQIAAADLALAFEGRGPGEFTDLDQLTIFADNAVPHVLRTDGILAYDEALAARIDAGELLPPGSPEEVEIRAAAIHAVELIVAELHRQKRAITSMQVDQLLWHASHASRYQARPPHRTRTIFY